MTSTRKIFLFCYEKEEIQNISLPSGIYLVEAWGASGGGANAGRGAFVRGILPLKTRTRLFFNIGGKGTSPTTKGSVIMRGGYNGGGNGGKSVSSVYYSGSSGGGATDVRLSKELNTRILVAAGGGGCPGKSLGGISDKGGYGGDLEGGLGQVFDEFKNMVKPATQTSGYSLGNGQDGRSSKRGANDGAEGNGGAGGGYYGGYSLQEQGLNTRAGGGGGSSYANPLYFIHVEMFSGANNIILPYGGTSIGNPDSGFLRIYSIVLSSSIRISSFNPFSLLICISYQCI